MIPIITSQLTANRCSTQRRVAKSLMILSVIGCVLACVSCNDQTQPIVDVSPIRDGLTLLGFAIVGSTVVLVLGRLLR